MAEYQYKWPDPTEAVSAFYSSQLRLPLGLFEDLQVKTPGGGRPAGRRRELWSATCVLGVAALEAGLEELFFSAFGVLTGRAGPTSRDVRRRLVEDVLVTPGPRKIVNLLDAHFGVSLGDLPPIARFEARRKAWALGGSGKGEMVQGPISWKELSDLHSALMWIRNGTAHGDAVKLHLPPPTAEGMIWVQWKDGKKWSIQQPHVLTGLRTVVAVYNTVAYELNEALDLFGDEAPLRAPNSLVDYL